MNKIKNPILKGFNPDPSICRVGEDYYIATSTFEWFPGVQIHHSKDLKNWNLIKRPLDRLSQLNMIGNPDSGGIWAPCLTYSDNLFWLIYTDVKHLSGAWKDSLNYLVTCDTITGDWSEPIFLNSTGFDPSLYHDDDGKKYLLNMVWDHREVNHPFYGIMIQEYSHEEKKLIGKSKVIFKGTEIKLTEGPHIYKINGYYYLMVAEGGTKYEHAVTVARSKNIMGPYELHPENPILTSWNSPTNPLQKAGHASLVHTHTDEWYLAHLVGRPLTERGCCPLGRETAIQKIEWKNGWPYVANGNEPSLYVEAPQMEEVKWEKSYPERDDFEEDQLNINFQTLRVPLDESVMTLKERKGYLRLRGKQSLTSKFLQAHVSRRWQSFNFDAITGLQFNPTSFQQMAGLVCYYNTENWVYINVTHDEEVGKIINLIECDNFKFTEPLKYKKIVVPEDLETVHFKVEVRRENYRFLYSFDEKLWVEIPITFDSNKLSDDYIRGEGFFTGAFVGICCQDATGTGIAADFDYFTYKEIY
ncbi:glycoside hydrolase family 43 protein [Clostridium cellulovorans]|uniref:Xylan 1,4-beta-xylosidase n=2 Tax=Clostridium cellulovorans TaxID=1493 RepID=D9SQU9_CLOC7|nr:glycoside hydrolase family 43 protein [Clostridium cellulovorans]ADL52305.1 Xylan 1,4-beta-xylosidase [Clostridium cellulovorans 743B]BAV13131.1 beta-xylosidase [Clostridium cellulovorans]